ncbi:type IX secretion system ring subunit PorN/GldN [Sediminitomix flava]|uniref:Gliding motility associated protein GldN n=1 Tax=Sediminitomix flava TaxID=379075 RepID=A0A315ZCS7_SEDFL|nr:gliding motility protein GldN [Sediminitomix flava]PWJ43351.1 gliding motility associated protein GldN [Sediminitomix flava]
MKIFKILFIGLFCFPFISGAQEAYVEKEGKYNPHSVRPIREDDIMWKKSLWFTLNLKTRVNEPFFAQNNEISKLLINAVKEDKIIPYMNDSLATRMSKEEFLKRLRVPQTEGLDEDMMEAWGDDLAAGNEYNARQFWLLEMKIDRVFDQRRSRMYNDIQSITLILPHKENVLELDLPIATFSFKELNENVFHMQEGGKTVDNPDAIWYNTENQAQHRNLTDAFNLELYHGVLSKYENPKDNTIVDFHGDGKNGYYKSLEALYQLMEYEATLWSY